MTVPYIEFRLGIEAIDYIRTSLADGKTLSRLILNVHNLDEGEVTTYLPKDVNSTTMLQFRVGGKVAVHPGPPKMVSETNIWLASEIRSFLNRDNHRIVVFENALAKPDDPWLRTRNAQAFFYEDDVYHFLTRKDAETDKVEKAIRDATSHLFIGAMSSMTPQTPFPEQSRRATRDQIKTIAGRTERIVVGAYDYEGYIIWTQKTGTSRSEKPEEQPQW